jgi:RNA polymerase sigma-B factor
MAERDEQRRQALFAELAETGSVDARNELVESFAPLAEYFANRYRRAGVDHEDVRQVAKLALVRAVDRFDPTVGVAFSTFAGRTIDGELKRHFRDRSWAVRVPRGLQEAALEVRRAADALSVEQGRPATVDDLVERTGLEPDIVLQALDVRKALSAQSIDQPGDPDDGRALSHVLGSTDASFDRVDSRLAIRRIIEELPERERTIIELRFYDELTQQEIADRLGISQMHVSRLLRRTLNSLRSSLD